MKPNKTITSENGIYELFEHYVVVRFNEGCHVSLRHEGKFIKQLFHDNFTDKFGWISDRVHSYSFDPALIEYLANASNNLVCFASVSYSSTVKNTHYLYDIFPETIALMDFAALSPAKDWVESIVINNSPRS